MELSDYRRGLFQWDTGRSLILTEKDITEVNFQLLPPPSGSTENHRRAGVGIELMKPYVEPS